MSAGNEPAYPVTAVDEREILTNGYGAFGLTKRELIAAMAMQGILANPARCAGAEVEGGPPAYAALTAKVSLEFADALLAQLSKEAP